MPTNVTEWVAWAGIVLPLLGIAGSAIRFVILEVQKRNDAKFQRYFDLMEQIGRKDYSIASKMAAVHELRKHTDYAEISIKVCEDIPVEGPSAQPLRDEMKATAEYLRKKASLRAKAT